MRPIASVLLLIVACVGPSSHAGSWQENFSYEKVALLNKVDRYRECIAVAPSREAMQGCQY